MPATRAREDDRAIIIFYRKQSYSIFLAHLHVNSEPCPKYFLIK